MGRRKQFRPRGGASAVQAAVTPTGPGTWVGDPRSAELFGPPAGGPVAVTERTALGVSAVWAAVRVIAGTISTLPFKVYRKRADGGRVDGPAAAGRLARKPCPEMPGSVFWETITQHAVTWGNGYAEIVRDLAGDVAELWLLTPDRVAPRRRPSGELYYEVHNGDGSKDEVSPADVFHLRGLGFDGLAGYSVVGTARRSLGATASGDQAAESLYANGLRPAMWIEAPAGYSPANNVTQKANAEEGLAAKHAGVSKWGRAMLLHGGMKAHQFSMSPGDAQFLQGRQFQVEEVARWFNVPPHNLRHLLRATFSNIEHQGTEFVTETLSYWLGRIAEEWQDKVQGAGSGLYAEHLLDALLRGDTITRYTAYGLGRQWGFLSPNDCRQKENMEPREGGDVLHVPVNMVPLGREGRPPEPPPGDPSPDPGSGGAAAAMATALARQLDHADADLLDQLAGEDPHVLRQWCERAGPEEWLARFPVHDSRLSLIQPHLAGTAFRSWLANGYAAMRRVHLSIAGDGDAAEAVRGVADQLRAGRWTASLAEMIRTGRTA